MDFVLRTENRPPGMAGKEDGHLSLSRFFNQQANVRQKRIGLIRRNRAMEKPLLHIDN
jgi:hypothetical protein